MKNFPFPYKQNTKLTYEGLIKSSRTHRKTVNSIKAFCPSLPSHYCFLNQASKVCSNNPCLASHCLFIVARSKCNSRLLAADVKKQCTCLEVCFKRMKLRQKLGFSKYIAVEKPRKKRMWEPLSIKHSENVHLCYLWWVRPFKASLHKLHRGKLQKVCNTFSED